MNFRELRDGDHSTLPAHSLGVAAFSTIVEWYDFTLYLYFATVLSRVFYGGGAKSLLLTLGGFAIGFASGGDGCYVDSDCDSDEFCQRSSLQCKKKLSDGTATLTSHVTTQGSKVVAVAATSKRKPKPNARRPRRSARKPQRSVLRP